MSAPRPVYLDHAATTPIHPAVIEAMAAVQATVGNASSLHTSGRAARRTIEESRENLAEKLGARPSEVIFTAGGTESDNLGVKGIFWARRDADPRRRRIITSAVEHHAVLDAVEWLTEHEGADVTWLPTDSDGSVSPAALRETLQRHDDVALVTVMWANNEVGTIMPIAELASVACGIRCADPQRCGSGGRAAAALVRGQRTVGDEHRCAQVRWVDGCGRAAATSRHRLRAVAARRWPGT